VSVDLYSALSPRPLMRWMHYSIPQTYVLSRHLNSLTRVLAVVLCLSVSVTSRSSVEMPGRTEVFFGMDASFDQSYTVF